MRRVTWIAASVVLLGVGGCQFTDFFVPDEVEVGQPFEIVIRGTCNGGGTLGPSGYAACALQLPDSFAVVASACSHPPAPLPTFTTQMPVTATAEPGHHVAMFYAQIASGVGSLRVTLRATAAGSFTIKRALSGMSPDYHDGYLLGYFTQTADPELGLNAQHDFATITGAAYVRSIRVVAGAARQFGLAAAGLPGAGTHTGIASGDFDGDGNDDLAIGTQAVGTRAFASHPGAAWIEQSTGLPTAGGAVACGDFDGDGFRDLVAADGRVYYGDGTGRWTPGPILPLAGPAAAFAVGDVDGDGRDDLAVAGAPQMWLRVFFGAANRTMVEHSSGLSLGFVPASRVLLADVDGDGHLDVVTQEPRIFAGDGAGNWAAPNGPPPSSYLDVAAGDLTGDGIPDLVLVPTGAAAATIYTHTAAGWQLVATNLTAPPGGSAVSLLDFDRDGRLDLVVWRTGDTVPAQFVVGDLWRNLGGAQFELVIDAGLQVPGAAPPAAAIGDFDGNTFPDVAVAVPGSGVFALLGRRGGVSHFGAGCSAPGFAAPTLDADRTPQPGTTTTIRCATGLPSTLAVEWRGTSKRFANGQPLLPFDLGVLGAPGCAILAAPLSARAALTDGNGDATFLFVIPNVPAFVGASVFHQAAVLTPGANALGLLVTGGLALRIAP